MNVIGKILSHYKWNSDQYLVTFLYYVQYDRNPRDFYNLDIKAIDQIYHRKIYDRLKEKVRQFIELDSCIMD